MLLSRTVYSLTREMYVAGCELHIQTLKFLVLTLKQNVNANSIRGNLLLAFHDYAASIQLTLVVFFRGSGRLF